MKTNLLFLILPFLIFFLIIPSVSSAFSIGGFVFNDINCNGQRNAGEHGIAGVSITLMPGSIVETTNSAGRYTFTGIKKGTYTITETDPVGYCSTSSNVRVVKITIGNVGGQHFADSKAFISPPGGCCFAD